MLVPHGSDNIHKNFDCQAMTNNNNCLLIGCFSFLLLQLVSTVQDALGDVEGLHSKLDRKRHVETTNQATHMKFQQGFHCEVSSMKEDLDGFAAAQQQLCSNLSDRIGKSVLLIN